MGFNMPRIGPKIRPGGTKDIQTRADNLAVYGEHMAYFSEYFEG